MADKLKSPDTGFDVKVHEFVELAKEKKWSISEGLNPSDLEKDLQDYNSCLADYQRVEAEYRSKRAAIRDKKLEINQKFQKAFRIVAGLYYKDKSVSILLNNFRRTYRKKRQTEPLTTPIVND